MKDLVAEDAANEVGDGFEVWNDLAAKRAQHLNILQDLMATLSSSKPFRSPPPWWKWWTNMKAEGLLWQAADDLKGLAANISILALDITNRLESCVLTGSLARLGASIRTTLMGHVSRV